MTTLQAKLEIERLRGRKLMVSTMVRILVAWLVFYPINLLILCWLHIGSLADAVLGFCTPLIRFLPPFSAPDSQGSWFVTEAGQEVPIHCYSGWEEAYIRIVILLPIALLCFLPLPMVATFRAIRRFLYLSLGPKAFENLGLVVAATHLVFSLNALSGSEHPRLMFVTAFLSIYPVLAMFDSDGLSSLTHDEDWKSAFKWD